MKIAIRGGHNVGVPGAHGILDEVTEDRKYYKVVMDYLRKAGHEVIDVTPEKTSTSGEDLAYGVNKANAAKVDLFVSCHINAGGGKGCEVIYGSDKGKVFADRVVNSIASLGFINRGDYLDHRGLYEIRATNMPAIIIEPFFLDTQSDVDLYNKVGYTALGKTIAEAINGNPIINSVPYPGYSVQYNPNKFDANAKLIQQKLGIAADGYFGNQTLLTVKAFQKSNGLTSDGIVGLMTWNKLFN